MAASKNTAAKKSVAAKPAAKTPAVKTPAAKKPAGKARRTVLRSSTGTKLYAVRDKAGQFKDIQTYKRAHGADIKRKSKGENGKVTKAK